MRRYYFDYHDDGIRDADDVGIELFELVDVTAAKGEAVRALAEYARDVIVGRQRRELAIEVREDDGPLFRTSINFEVDNLSLW